MSAPWLCNTVRHEPSLAPTFIALDVWAVTHVMAPLEGLGRQKAHGATDNCKRDKSKHSMLSALLLRSVWAVAFQVNGDRSLRSSGNANSRARSALFALSSVAAAIHDDRSKFIASVAPFTGRLKM